MMKQRFYRVVLFGVVAMVAASAWGWAQEAAPGSAVPPPARQHVYAPEQEGWFLFTLWCLYYVLVWLVGIAGLVMPLVLWWSRRSTQQGQSRRFAATDAAGAAVLLLSVAAYFFAYQWHVLLLVPIFGLAYMQKPHAEPLPLPAYMRAADAWVHFASLGHFSLLKPTILGGEPRTPGRGAKLLAVFLLPLWVVFAPYWLALLCLVGFCRHYTTR